MLKAQKEEVVANLAERLAKARGAVIVEFQGLTVAESTKLRRSFAGQGVDFKVVKNTLLRRAAQDAGVEGLSDLLTGPNAIAFSYDQEHMAAKAIGAATKQNREISIKAGLLNGKVIDLAAVKVLADLPDREVLLTRAAVGMQSPILRMAQLLQAPVRDLAYGVKALADKREAEGA